jgi:hypothetical protein
MLSQAHLWRAVVPDVLFDSPLPYLAPKPGSHCANQSVYGAAVAEEGLRDRL